MRTTFILALATAIIGSTAAAQFPPQRATNLQVLPKDISMDSLMNVMGSFTRALGVRCTHCHVQREGQTFEQMDFSLDENPKKAVARTMLRMVAAINNDHLSQVADRRKPDIHVTCATCHRGVVEPRALQDVLLNVYDVAGPDSVEKAYNALRERYHGSGSYDFGEVPLSNLATSIAARGRATDAIRFHSLNTRMNPRSTFALRQLAQAHVAVHDTAAAVAAYDRALAINPSDAQSARARDALRRRPQ